MLFVICRRLRTFRKYSEHFLSGERLQTKTERYESHFGGRNSRENLLFLCKFFYV